MTSCKRVLIRLGYSVIVLTSLASVASRSLASECTHFTSRDATAQEELRLCEREINGPVETYACREYRDAGNRYELLFKGGPAPKAIRQQATGDEQASLRAFSRADAQGQACRQTPPPGVPTHATYRGTGVCLDAKDRSVPCSLFEHAMARDPVAMRYLVLYDPQGGGPIDIDAQPVGENTNAIPAELAFQIGRALASTGCCEAEAHGYLAHAVALFPGDATYRASLQSHAKKQDTIRDTPLAVFNRMLNPSH